MMPHPAGALERVEAAVGAASGLTVLPKHYTIYVWFGSLVLPNSYTKFNLVWVEMAGCERPDGTAKPLCEFYVLGLGTAKFWFSLVGTRRNPER